LGRQLSVEIIGTEALTPAERSLWLGWTAASKAYESPFFHPDFTAVAGRTAPEARLAVLHRNGTVVGFLPHQRRGGAAQPLGAPLNDYHAVITGPDLDFSLQEAAELVGARSYTATGWMGPANEGEGRTQARTLLADASQGWDAWYEGRKGAFGKFFKDKERARRSLERDLGPIRIETATTDLSHFDRLIALKQEQYQRTRRHDIFACGWTVDMLRALLTHQGEDFGARLAVLYAGDRPMAYELGLQGGGHYHFWLPAYEADAARYSPGMLLSMETIKARSAQGLDGLYDFGFEGEAYKKYFCDQNRMVWEGIGHAAGPTALAAISGLAPGALAQSVRRRWAIIDACETTTLGRVRALSAAASAMAGRGRAQPAASLLLAASALCL
jgi:CelD/BcsL family acetyltransferase involved in cellulose biosynthesis